MTGTGELAGKRILVVEDEYYIAADLKRALASAGAEVLGPVAEVESALELLGGDAPDAAVLDVNLGGDRSYRVADRLAAVGAPYLFLTGYDGWSLAEAYQAAPRLAKPFAMEKLLATLEQLIEARAPA